MNFETDGKFSLHSIESKHWRDVEQTFQPFLIFLLGVFSNEIQRILYRNLISPCLTPDQPIDIRLDRKSNHFLRFDISFLISIENE